MKSGYLSASVRQLVSSHDWSLIWDSEEDRIVDYPFTVSNRSLEDGLTSLLSIYQGAFVADIYVGNKVVRIVTAQPGTTIDLPEAQVAVLAEPAAEAAPPAAMRAGSGSEAAATRAKSDEAIQRVAAMLETASAAAEPATARDKPENAADTARTETSGTVRRVAAKPRPQAKRVPQPDGRPPAEAPATGATLPAARTQPGSETVAAQANPDEALRRVTAMLETAAAAARTPPDPFQTGRPAAAPRRTAPETKPPAARTGTAMVRAGADAAVRRVAAKPRPQAKRVPQPDDRSPAKAPATGARPSAARTQSGSGTAAAQANPDEALRRVTAMLETAAAAARTPPDPFQTGRPATAPRRTAPETKPPAARAEATARPAAATRHLQVLATDSRRKARAEVDRLKHRDHSAYIHQVQKKGRTLYRVRVDPKLEARFQEIKNALEGLGYQTWVVRPVRR